MNLRALLKALTGKQDSKDVAKERLRLVLVHDRASVSPEFLEKVKEEIVRVISQYMEIDEEQTAINMHHTEGTAVLEANLAIRTIRRNM